MYYICEILRYCYSMYDIVRARARVCVCACMRACVCWCICACDRVEVSVLS